ncbi:hypothetical protein L9F63_015411, partial [Diploptera punctata]
CSFCVLIRNQRVMDLSHQHVHRGLNSLNMDVLWTHYLLTQTHLLCKSVLRYIQLYHLDFDRMNL